MSTSDRKRSRFKLAALIAIPLAVLGAGLAYAHQHGGHGCGMMSHDGMSAHLDQVQGVLGRIGATDAQKSRIDATLKTAFSEFKVVRDDHHAAFGKLHELLLAPSVDRGQIEALRAAQVKSLEDASRRLVTAFEDVAETLTPEQRAAFAQEVRKHHD